MLTKRERVIAIGVGAVLAIAAADYWGFTPYLQARDDLDKKIAQSTSQLREMSRLHEDTNRKWKTILANGLKEDATSAEEQVINKLRDWAESSRITGEWFRTENPPRVGDFIPIRISSKVTAKSAGLGKFLHQIETASFPIHINELQIVPSKEGNDDLVVNITVTTVIFSPLPDETKSKAPAAKGST